MKMNLKFGRSKIKMVGWVLMLVMNCGAAQAQPQQGLMSRLIEIKYGTELYLTMELKSETVIQNIIKNYRSCNLNNTRNRKSPPFD